MQGNVSETKQGASELEKNGFEEVVRVSITYAFPRH